MNAENNTASGPFDNLRDYLAVLEARGRVLRVPEIDQDSYEASALVYRLVERFGVYAAPVVIFERIRIDGQWLEGPLITNMHGGWDYDALAYGVNNPEGSPSELYQAAIDKLIGCRGSGDTWPVIKPVEVSAERAPCKEVVLIGGQVDLLKFPFIQSNPADGGRYINTGCVVTEDPELGRNLGIYRCQIQGPRKIAISTGPGKDGWTMIMAAKERGEPHAKVAIAVGVEPVIYAMAGSPTARTGEDELALTGGFRGRPVDIVRCETSELCVPAAAELIVEGEVPFDFVDEGPFGERYGYLGPQRDLGLLMNVTAVTHRKSPWITNQFTGVLRGTLSAASEANTTLAFRKWAPNLKGIHFPDPFPGWCFISINKQKPGEAPALGQQVAKYLPNAKVIAVVDADVDIHNHEEVLHTIGARWQPGSASEVIEQAFTMPMDPSLPERDDPDGMTGSKIVIDATRQWPEEGGPKVYPKLNRTCLTDAEPDVLARVDKKFADLL